MTELRVMIETGSTKVFATALHWPGWSRSAKDEIAAVERLMEYQSRYESVVARAGVAFGRSFTPVVVEHVDGGASTDFGVPSKHSATDRAPTTVAERERLVALMHAAWDEFDAVATAAPRELRKGPRGGGRDTDKIVAHIVDAENGYKGKLGIRGVSDAAGIRAAMVEAVLAGREPEKPGQWTVRYAARRIAWHALDHAWEIQDRSG
jgi:hypothetical protein